MFFTDCDIIPVVLNPLEHSDSHILIISEDQSIVTDHLDPPFGTIIHHLYCHHKLLSLFEGLTGLPFRGWDPEPLIVQAQYVEEHEAIRANQVSQLCGGGYGGEGWFHQRIDSRLFILKGKNPACHSGLAVLVQLWREEGEGNHLGDKIPAMPGQHSQGWPSQFRINFPLDISWLFIFKNI